MARTYTYSEWCHRHDDCYIKQSTWERNGQEQVIRLMREAVMSRPMTFLHRSEILDIIRYVEKRTVICPSCGQKENEFCTNTRYHR